ncbi:MAG: hypothetical protein RL768_2376 [Nitrospirota bacterium]|jgi:hypothetical protein
MNGHCVVMVEAQRAMTGDAIGYFVQASRVLIAEGGAVWSRTIYADLFLSNSFLRRPSREGRTRSAYGGAL